MSAHSSQVSEVSHLPANHSLVLLSVASAHEHALTSENAMSHSMQNSVRTATPGFCFNFREIPVCSKAIDRQWLWTVNHVIRSRSAPSLWSSSSFSGFVSDKTSLLALLDRAPLPHSSPPRTRHNNDRYSHASPPHLQSHHAALLTVLPLRTTKVETLRSVQRDARTLRVSRQTNHQRPPSGAHAVRMQRRRVARVR